MPTPTVAISVNAAWNLVNFRHSLLHALVNTGYRVVAIAPRDGREIELAKLGVAFEPIEMDRRGMSPLADARLLLSYVRLLRRLRPVAYLGFTIKPNVYGGLACRILGIPMIANVAGLGTAFLKRGALNLLVRALYAAGLRRADRVFFQNADDLNRFVADRLVHPDRAGLLPGSGVDLVRFTPEHRKPDGKTVFLLVARLLRAKGVAEFVQAATQLRVDHGNEMEFRILGIRDHSAGGVDAATLDKWQRDGIVQLLQAVDDVRPVLAGADCVVLPSYYPEGTPRSLLEAAAMGKAIVTTDMPGCRDVVRDGVNGFLCTPRSAHAVAEAMERYLGLDMAQRRAMADQSRLKAEREFDEAIVIDRYLKAIAELTATKA